MLLCIDYVLVNGKMTNLKDMVRIRKGAVEAKLLSQYLSGETEENQNKTPRSG
jgi:hypothetical protein